MKVGPVVVKVEPRKHVTWRIRVIVPLLAVAGALLVGALVLALQGEDTASPWTVYRAGLGGSFGSRFAFWSTVMEGVPLILTGAAAALALRASLVNLGGEGQLYLGAIGAAAVGLGLGNELPAVIVVPLAILAGALAGSFWALLAAVPRAKWGTNEILPTLMLNFVALNVMNYLIFGSASFFRDDVVSTFPTGKTLPPAARLPSISSQLDLSLIIAVGAVLVLAALLARTRAGLRIAIVGDAPAAARYAGISLPRMVLGVLGVSGALAGVAGAVLVTGEVGALEPRTLAVGLGFTGLLVAALARFNLVAVIPVAVLIGAIDTAAPAIQRLGVPESLVLVLEGLILFFVALGEYLLRYRIIIEVASRSSVTAAGVEAAS